MTGTSPAPASSVAAAGSAVAQLLARFSKAIDSRRPDQVAAHFDADGVFKPGAAEVRGRAAIQEFYAARLTDPRRTTRHLWTNVEILDAGETDILVKAVLTTYAFEPAISETDLQMRVGDVEMRCVRDGDGTLRFATHLYERVFTVSLPLSS